MILINKGGARSLAVSVHWERDRAWSPWRKEAGIFDDFSFHLNSLGVGVIKQLWEHTADPREREKASGQERERLSSQESQACW